jgi:CHAT domain-containing protein/tetratricopeptide (TPR) repeat protein
MRALFAVTGLACFLSVASVPVAAQTPAQLDRAVAAGKAAFERNDFATAIKLWSAALPALEKKKDARTADLFLLIGFAYYHGNGDARDALVSFRKALALHRALGQKARVSGDLSSIGGAEETLGDDAGALASYRAALSLDRAAGDKQNVADDLGAIGKLERLLAQNDAALAHLQEAVALDRELKDQAGEATHRGEMGNVLNELARYSEAIAAQQAAIALHRALKDRAGEAGDLGNLANAEENLGRFDDALALDRQALDIDRALGIKSAEASDLGNIGNAEGDLGRYDDALASHRQALALHREIADQREEAADLLNIGGIQEQLGRYDDALNSLRAALAIYRSAGDRSGEARVLADIGTIDEQLGSYADALAIGSQALALHRTIDDKRDQATDLGDIGNVQIDLGRYADALATYQQSLTIERTIGDRPGEAGNLLNTANAYLFLNRYADGLAAQQQALAIHRAIDSPLGVASDLANIADAEVVLGRYADAREAAGQAVALSTQLGAAEVRWRSLSGAAYADEHLDRRDDALGEYDAALDAIEALRSGLSGSERGSFFTNKLFVYDEYVAYLVALDAKFPGKGYDRKALEVLERRSARATLEQIGASAARHFRGVDSSVVDDEDNAQSAIDRSEAVRSKLLAAHGIDPSALAAADATVAAAQAQAASLEATIQTRFPAYYALRHPQPLVVQCRQAPCPTLATFQQSVLRKGEVVLIYALLDGGSALWVVGRDRIALYPLPARDAIDASVAKVAAHFAGISSLLESGAGDSRIERSTAADLPGLSADSFALYRMLVPPGAAAAIARATDLVVVPSGSLYRVSFETLVDRDPSADGPPHYVLDDAPVSYIPSASLLAVVRGSYAQPTVGRSPLLAFANPAFGAPPAQTRGLPSIGGLQLAALRSAFVTRGAAASPLVFPALPGTQTEADAVRGALGAAPDSVIVGADATRARVLALNAAGQLKSFRFLLFATHAVLPGEIHGLSQPAIVLAHPERGDGLLTMSDVFDLSLDADFVALSACNTGVAAAGAGGDSISGLTRAFLFAGTPAISVTLWEVDDAAAPQLTPPFFAGMHAGAASAAQALRRAKLALLQSPQARFRHPYAWGPSVIFGDGDRPGAP